MNARIPCNYAIVRFLPYPEAGEFVNVGVVVHSPATGFFDFCLLPPKRTGRIRGFFPELDLVHYRTALKHCWAELTRMRGEVGIAGATAQQVALDPAVGLALFRELIRPRETLVRFSAAGSALVDEPEQYLGELFERYVLRMFAREAEYQEEIMCRRVTGTLRAHRLITRYHEARVGNEVYNVYFPFVHQPRVGRFERAIKPLNLAQDQSSKILDHGSLWVNRVERLRNAGALPERVLFVVHEPETGDARRKGACEEIWGELEALDVLVTSEKDEAGLIDFAGAALGDVAGHTDEAAPGHP